MSIHEHLLSVTDDNYVNPDISTRNDSKIISSDREVLPDELSTDHGEGHGKGKGGKKASIFGSAMNIANTIMGAGILALPNVISQFGIVLGSIIITVSCILTYFSCVLLLKAKNLSHHSKYISIGKHCFGAKGLWAVKVIIIVNNVGLCIAYLIIFATVSQNLISGFVPECDASSDSGPFYCRSWFLSLIAAILVLPLVFARSMAKLQHASAIAVLAAAIFSIITIEHFFEAWSRGENAQDVNVLPDVSNIPAALASITSVFLAFTFQFNFFPVYKTLHNPSDSRMKKTTASGLILVLIIYLSVANCGYLTFGNNSQDLLSNFTKSAMGMTTFVIINIAFLVSAMLTLPLMFFGAKNEIYGVIKLVRRHIAKRKVGSKKIEQSIEPSTLPLESEREVEPENEDDEKVIERKYGFKGFRFNIYIAILFCLIVLLAIVLPGINVVFSFVGSTAANGLNFLLPPLFYISLASKKGKLRPIAIGILSLGVVMGIVGIVSSALTPAP